MSNASHPANVGNDPGALPANPAPTAPPAEVVVLVAAPAHDDVPGPVAAPTQGDVPGPVTAPGFAPPAALNEVDTADASNPANAGNDPGALPANPAPTVAPPAEVVVLVAAPAHDDVPGPVAATTQGDMPGQVTAPGFAPPAAANEVDIAGIWLPDPSQADYMFIVNLPKLSR